MTANKYGNTLTVILIILIIAIIVGIGFFAYKYVIEPKKDRNAKIEAFSQIDDNFIEEKDDEETVSDTDKNEIMEIEGPEQIDNNQNSTGKTRNKKYYKEFVMLGYITISKTNVKEPILDTVTPESLNAAVAVLYPSNAQLNQPGNVVIIGHNYRNGKFFSNNKKLSVGDKIKIKDNSGKELTYTIYEKFETTEQDTSFYNRDTNGKIEITLSTCTDDSKKRTIILARVD